MKPERALPRRRILLAHILRDRAIDRLAVSVIGMQSTLSSEGWWSSEREEAGTPRNACRRVYTYSSTNERFLDFVTLRMSPKNASDVAKKRVLALLSTNPHDDVSNLVCSLSFHSDSDKKFARLLHAQRADHLLVVTSGSEQINPTKNESSRAYYLLC